MILRKREKEEPEMPRFLVDLINENIPADQRIRDARRYIFQNYGDPEYPQKALEEAKEELHQYHNKITGGIWKQIDDISADVETIQRHVDIYNRSSFFGGLVTTGSGEDKEEHDSPKAKLALRSAISLSTVGSFAVLLPLSITAIAGLIFGIYMIDPISDLTKYLRGSKKIKSLNEEKDRLEQQMIQASRRHGEYLRKLKDISIDSLL